MFTELSYNDLINACVAWGKVNMTQPEFQDILTLYEESITSLLKEYDRTKNEIEDWPNLIKTPIEGCKKLFQNIAIIEADPGESMHHSVEEAFTRFDHLVFFNHTLETLLSEKYTGECTQIKINLSDLCSATAAAVDQLAVWVHESVSPLRLTPFNELRKICYEFIQQQYRFLFPWYELMVDAPEDLLMQFEQHFSTVSAALAGSGQVDALRQLFGPDALLYIQELRAEHELLSAIKQNVAFSENVKQVISQHPELRLARAADVIQQKRYLPTSYWDYPLVSIISKKFIQATSTPDRVAGAFLSALVGPCPEAHRLETFTWVVRELQNIKTNKCHDKNLTVVLDCLNKYLQGKLDMDSMCEQVFDLWEGIIDGLVAGEVKSAEDITLKDFWSSLQQIMLAPLGKQEIIKIKGIEARLKDRLIKVNKQFKEPVENWVKDNIDKIKSLSELWEPQWTGEMVTAADIPEQNHVFLTEEGKIKINCCWGPSQNDEPSYIQISWKADISAPCQIWMRFLDPCSEKEYVNVCLGSELAGERILTSRALGFEPSRQRWAVRIFFTSI